MEKYFIVVLSFILFFLQNDLKAGEKNTKEVKKIDKTVKVIKKHQISRYSVPKISELPKDVQKILKGAKKRKGFTPNVLKALSHRPEELKAFLNYNKVIMSKKSGLSKAEKEMIIVAFSSKNGCSYCVQAHGATLRVASKNPTLSDQIAINYRKADITPREKAMIEFALKVSYDSKSIEESDFIKLRKHGFSDEDIWDIASITAFYNLSNRMMNFLKVRPDDEFYRIGR